MKVELIKLPGGSFVPGNDVDAEKLSKLTNNNRYEVDVKVKQNNGLHRKMFLFFSFCTRHYYGDIDAHKDTYQLDYVRKHLTIQAGYHKQVFNREGTQFEIVAQSLSYSKMTPEDKQDLYSRVINAAIVHVFDGTTDENILNQLQSFF